MKSQNPSYKNKEEYLDMLICGLTQPHTTSKHKKASGHYSSLLLL